MKRRPAGSLDRLNQAESKKPASRTPSVQRFYVHRIARRLAMFSARLGWSRTRPGFPGRQQAIDDGAPSDKVCGMTADDDPTKAAKILFAEQLRKLHDAAGTPSLRDLEILTKQVGYKYAASTMNDKLNARTPAEWLFVETFVKACVRHAGGLGELGALHLWRARWERMQQSAMEGRPTPENASSPDSTTPEETKNIFHFYDSPNTVVGHDNTVTNNNIIRYHVKDRDDV